VTRKLPLVRSKATGAAGATRKRALCRGGKTYRAAFALARPLCIRVLATVTEDTCSYWVLRVLASDYCAADRCVHATCTLGAADGTCSCQHRRVHWNISTIMCLEWRVTDLEWGAGLILVLDSGPIVSGTHDSAVNSPIFKRCRNCSHVVEHSCACWTL
jgi:hypothetical protein